MSQEQSTSDQRVRFEVYCDMEDDRMRVSIFDDEFHWDVTLRVYGDFGDMEDKLRFAQAICDALNAAGDKIPKE